MNSGKVGLFEFFNHERIVEDKSEILILVCGSEKSADARESWRVKWEERKRRRRLEMECGEVEIVWKRAMEFVSGDTEQLPIFCPFSCTV